MLIQTPSGKVNTNPAGLAFVSKYPGTCDACKGQIEPGHLIIQTPFPWYKYRITSRYIHKCCKDKVNQFIQTHPGHAGPVKIAV